VLNPSYGLRILAIEIVLKLPKFDLHDPSPSDHSAASLAPLFLGLRAFASTGARNLPV
jgi:hypothetical protein